MGTSLIIAEDLAKLGPAMSALNERQRAFVYAMLQTGGSLGDYTECARMAGYAETTNQSLRAQAYKLSHHPGIQAAIAEMADERIRTGAIIGASRLIEIASDPTHKDSLKASIELLNRSGLLVTTQHKVIVEHDADDLEKIKRIVASAKALGLDARKLLGEAGVAREVIDAEFSVIETNWLEEAI